jgi:hypothetical protein
MAVAVSGVQPSGSAPERNSTHPRATFSRRKKGLKTEEMGRFSLKID